MKTKLRTTAMLVLAAGAMAGCAADGTFDTSAGLTTQAVTPAAAPKVDPACVSLAAQIGSLRKEGTIDRLQQAAAGKTASVQVKRAALAKQAELNKANADFQAKCATITPTPATNATAPGPAARDAASATVAPAQKAAVTATATKAAATKE